jgi:hypothetical protein
MDLTKSRIFGLVVFCFLFAAGNIKAEVKFIENSNGRWLDVLGNI